MEKLKSFLQNSQRVKVWSIGAILVGCMLCVLGFSLVDYNIYELNPNPIEIVWKEKTVPLNDISFLDVDVSHSNVTVESIDGEQIQLQYEERVDRPLTIDIQNKNLTIHSKKKIEFFKFNWMNIDKREKPSLKLIIPKNFTGDLRVATAYGTISIDSLKGIEVFTIENEHGEINVKDIEAASVSIENANGFTNVSDVKSSDVFSVENEHDGIEVKNIDASEILLVNAYGSIVSNHLVSRNDFIIVNQHNDASIKDSTAKNFHGDMAYGYLELDTMKLENEFRLINEHDDVNLKNVQSKNSVMEVAYGSITLKDWLSDNIKIDVEHGDLFGDIVGVEADYHIISNVEHGDSNLAKERNAGKTKRLDITLSYGYLEINFNE